MESDFATEVQSLLDAVGISTVVVVDEEYRPQIETMLSAGQQADNTLLNIDGIGQIDFSSAPEVWRTQLRGAWEELGEPEKIRALNDLCTKVGIQPTVPVGLDPLSQLSPDIDFRGISPEVWDIQKKDVIGAGQNVPTLVLFDRDFGDGGEDGGLRCAIELYDSDPQGFLWAGLLTNTVPIEDESHVWEELSLASGGHSDRFILLSKMHLQGDASSFPEALRIVLMSQPASTLQKSARNQIGSCVTAAVNKMAGLSTPEFERMVFCLARDEGIWEVDVLLRLFGIYLRSDVRQRLHNSHSVRRATRRLRALNEFQAGAVNPVTSIAQRIYRHEIYEESEHLCNLRLPLELGDIFKKKAGSKQYILVGQPCDLMVRGDGKRSPEIAFATLLPIRETNPNECSTGPSTSRSVFQLPAYCPDGEPAWVELDRPSFVPIESLDYCALSETGDSLGPKTDQTPDWLLPSWLNRWNRLAEEADSIRESLAKLSGKPAKLTHVKACFGIRKDSAIKPSMQGGNYHLGLKRVARLLPPYSRALLSSYSGHNSREAFEPALTRSY